MKNLPTDALQAERTAGYGPIQSQNVDRIAIRFRILCALVSVSAFGLLAFEVEGAWDPFWSIGRPYAFGVLIATLLCMGSHFIASRLLYIRSPQARTDATAKHWYVNYFRTLRYYDVLVALATLVITISSFTAYKSLVVGADGYHYDSEFIAWDRFIFGGVDPWQITHTVFSSPTATSVLEFLYHPAFLPMLIGYTACVAVRARPELRYTYMASYLICFVAIGMLAANMMNSAGPAFDGLLFGDGNIFAPLNNQLSNQSEQAGPFLFLKGQAYLLQRQQNDMISLGSGISAMPSMHIVLASLWMLSAWHLNRWLGYIMTLYALTIWVGSVHLGWHYFVDGLVGLGMLLIIWVAVGRAFGLFGRPIMSEPTEWTS